MRSTTSRRERVLIIDDIETITALEAAFREAGIVAESVDETFAAMEKLGAGNFSAVILDPTIRDRLNGYAVLNFLELEQPSMLDNVFLWTGMSEQTIRRTAPAVLPRLFRKSSPANAIVSAVVEACGMSAPRTIESPSVLVVEDDRATAEATLHVLRELGYSAHWARNGQDALQTLGARDFDAIVLDLVMPDVDGFTVLEHFRESAPSLMRRVIVITGMPERYIGSLETGALCGVLRKPLDVARLTALLANCTRQT